jgi:uncharacterized protein YecE (DUF72 family)
MAGVRIGTSGYVYPHWRKGVFDASGLPGRQELAYYAARFRRVELAVCIPVGGRLEPDRITTAPFTCIRMHRGQEPAGGFSKEELKSWAAQVRALAASGKEIYIYFNPPRRRSAPPG